MYEEALEQGKVLDEIGTAYMYWYSKSDSIVWLLHQADKRIFKATFYDKATFKLPPKSEFKILERYNIIID